MQFSIIIPSWNNLNYLKICIKSIKKNSLYNHDINVHLNEGSDGSVEFLKENKIKFSRSEKNIGLCSGSNSAASLADTEYIVYSNDDMYEYIHLYNCKNIRFIGPVVGRAMSLSEPLSVLLRRHL